MPLPLIILYASAFCAGIGLGAGANAIERNRQFKKIVNSANEKLMKKHEELETCQLCFIEIADRLNSTIKRLDDNILPKLRELAETIDKRAELKLEYVRLNKQLFDVLKDKNAEIAVSSQFLNAIESVAKGAAVSAVTPTLLMSLATSVGTASTGTAISALSGIAAKNAALAWLGGGALSAGGAGIAGGMLTIGTATAGLGLLVAGLTLNAKAEKELTKAKKYEGEVELEIVKIDGFIKKKEVERKKVEQVTSISERVYRLLDLLIGGIDRANMKEDDVQRVIKAIVILEKFREILSTNISDARLDDIILLCREKLDEAKSIINKFDN